MGCYCNNFIAKHDEVSIMLNVFSIDDCLKNVGYTK
ncbi:MAG: hypothetical protein K0Q97_2425 [Bacillota bacterium]|nr:hypothetical protein [Bacillota bacterium]